MTGQLPPKFTLKQWVSHPTTILLITVTTLLWGIIYIWVNSQLKEVAYLKERIAVLEKREAERAQKDSEYIRTIIFKEAQLKNQAVVIDSLQKGGQE